MGAGIVWPSRRIERDSIAAGESARSRESRRGASQIPAEGCDGGRSRPADRRGGQNAGRFRAEPRGDESALAGRGDVSHLQHRLRIGRPPAPRDWDFALVRRDAQRSAGAFPGGSDRARCDRRVSRIGGRAASRAASGRRGRRNDFVALRARECEAGGVGPVDLCHRLDNRTGLGRRFRVASGARGGANGTGPRAAWRHSECAWSDRCSPIAPPGGCGAG